MAERNMVDVNPGTWSPKEPGDNISGVLINIKEKVGKFKSKGYYIETEAGKILFVFGSAVLDDRMALVPVGTYCTIEYKGREPNKAGQETIMYQVQKELKPSN